MPPVARVASTPHHVSRKISRSSSSSARCLAFSPLWIQRRRPCAQDRAEQDVQQPGSQSALRRARVAGHARLPPLLRPLRGRGGAGDTAGQLRNGKVATLRANYDARVRAPPLGLGEARVLAGSPSRRPCRPRVRLWVVVPLGRLADRSSLPTARSIERLVGHSSVRWNTDLGSGADGFRRCALHSERRVA